LGGLGGQEVDLDREVFLECLEVLLFVEKAGLDDEVLGGVVSPAHHG